MERRTAPRRLIGVAVSLLLAMPLLAGCGGGDSGSNGSGGGTYYNGPMKGKGQPGGAGATGATGATGGAGDKATGK